MRLCFALIALALVTACRPEVLSPTPTTNTSASPLSGNVTIITPAEGSMIYSEILYLSGTANGVPGDRITLIVTGPDGETLAQADTTIKAGQWQVELPHRYNGEPTEVTIRVLPARTSSDTDYTNRIIALADLRYRPDGLFGTITTPVNNSAGGGELLRITGTASGMRADTLSVDLIADEGHIVTRTYASTTNPYRVDVMPFVAELATQNYTGRATIQLGVQNDTDNTVIPLDTISVLIDTAAG
jgi:hypothetical protein